MVAHTKTISATEVLPEKACKWNALVLLETPLIPGWQLLLPFEVPSAVPQPRWQVTSNLIRNVPIVFGRKHILTQDAYWVGITGGFWKTQCWFVYQRYRTGIPENKKDLPQNHALKLIFSCFRLTWKPGWDIHNVCLYLGLCRWQYGITSPLHTGPIQLLKKNSIFPNLIVHITSPDTFPTIR